MIFKQLKDKCYYYQKLADYKLMPNSYVLVHVDGRAFSNYCEHFHKPFDEFFIATMNKVATYLCQKVSNCLIGYVQSDEITLLIVDNNKSDGWFKLRICKLCSIISSLASTKFMQIIYSNYLNNNDESINIENIPLAEFDCKVWNVPNLNEAYCWFNFRQIDCIRNSKQMVSQTYLPHKELIGLTCDEQIIKVKEKFGIDWNNFTDGEKFGRFIIKKDVQLTNNCCRKKWSVINAYPIQKEFKNNFLQIIENNDN